MFDGAVIFAVYGVDAAINILALSFSFKFSNALYHTLCNCGDAHRATKCCFPLVKTAALTWKFQRLCCVAHSKNETVYGGLPAHDKTPRADGRCINAEAGMFDIAESEEIQIYHMARREVELMIRDEK